MTEEEKKAFEWLDHIIDVSYPEQSMEQVLNNKNVIFYYIEKLQKENEELRKLTVFQKEYRNKLEQDLFENCSNFVVPKDKIKKKIEELEKAGTTETRNNKNEVVERHYFLQDEIVVLTELLEEK